MWSENRQRKFHRAIAKKFSKAFSNFVSSNLPYRQKIRRPKNVAPKRYRFRRHRGTPYSTNPFRFLSTYVISRRSVQPGHEQEEKSLKQTKRNCMLLTYTYTHTHARAHRGASTQPIPMKLRRLLHINNRFLYCRLKDFYSAMGQSSVFSSEILFGPYITLTVDESAAWQELSQTTRICVSYSFLADEYHCHGSYSSCFVTPIEMLNYKSSNWMSSNVNQ